LALSAVAIVVAIAGALVVRDRARSIPTPAATTTDSAAAQPGTLVLSHEDSLAIASAVHRKMEEEQPKVQARRDSVRSDSGTSGRSNASSAQEVARQVAQMAESLRTAIERAVLDSIARQRGAPAGSQVLFRFDARAESLARALRGRTGPGGDRRGLLDPPRPSRPELSPEQFAERLENMGPPRRILVSYPVLSNRSAALAPVVDSMVDRLRAELSRNPRYVVVDADTVRAALRRTRNVSMLAQSLQVDLFASIDVSLMPEGAVMWIVTLRDLSAHSGFSTRSTAIGAPNESLLAGADSLTARALRHLVEMDRSPRRPTAGDGRPGRGRP
jgi:hypothetical protein